LHIFLLIKNDDDEKKFSAPLGVDSKLFYRAFANLYVEKQNPQLALYTQLPITVRGGAVAFQDDRRAKFSENLCVLLFIKDLSNETTFGQIYLGGH
jgi:hypothetical protein